MKSRPVFGEWGLRAIALGMALGWGGAARGQTPYPINVFSPAPRELRQFLTRAQAAIEEERFSDAVQELGQILNTPESDDFFLGLPGTDESQISLKAQAMTLLGSLPAKGRNLYELQFGTDAKKALEEALAAGNLAGVTEVSRRYFHTKAGYEATLLLGRIQLDQGHPLAAALTLRRVAEVPWAATQYDPELSVLLATAWMYAGQTYEARQTLVELKQRLPQARLKLLDKEVALFNDPASALNWLQGIVGESRRFAAGAAARWALFRGDERRNAESVGGVPLLNFTWRLPTVNDPADEARVASRHRMLRDRGEPLVCALQPLVVGDYALLRQPESSKLVGINLKKHGKREWVYPPFDDNLAAQAARQSMPNNRNPAINVREEELKQRIWDDNTFGQVSSDGRQVYVIDDLGFAEMPSASSPRVFVGRGGRPILNTNNAKAHNLLVALDLQKQGYQLWAVGGATGDDPALAGAFFMGPPLPVGDLLYAIAEFSGEVRLVALSPRTGAQQWKQQLAVLEEPMHILNDRLRRLAGASPSLADGILVCPTAAGAVAAVDLATRTLRWGYQYGRSDLSFSPQSRFGTRMTLSNGEGGRWLDGTVTLAEGAVVLTPVESQQLHCLDLLTGKPKWPAQPRDDMLFVGCVHQGRILLVGKDRLKAVRVSDGASAWVSDLKLADETVTGRGYYNGKHYFLPVTGQKLLKIDMEEGKIVGQAQTEVELGNVVCYQNQLISQSPQYAAAFVLLSAELQKQLEERLAANPLDIEALSTKAQILLQEGKAEASLALLRQATRQAPDQPTLRGLLVKVMLALVRQDLDEHWSLTEELERLVTDPVQRREVLRWRVLGLASAGRTWDAFETLLELADQELAQGAGTVELQTVDRELAVRSDRWIQGQLQRLWQLSDAETKARMTAALQTRLEQMLPGAGLGQLRALLNLFGFHEATHRARLALAEKLISADALLEAELLLGQTIEAADAEIAGAGHALLARLYVEAKRLDAAAAHFRLLAGKYADTVCRAGLTGKVLAAQAAEDAALRSYLSPAWPSGQVKASETVGSGNANPLLAFQRLTYPVPIGQHYGAARHGLWATYDPAQYALALKGELGQTLATASLRSSDRRYLYTVQNYSLTARANGHLMVVNLGPEVAAVDGLRGDRSGEALLWRQETVDSDPNLQRQIYPQQRAASNPLLGGRYYVYDPTGKVNFNTAPVRAVGFCFQRGRQLVCVDPLSGQSLWERSPIPNQAEIFGDDELIFVADGSGNDTLVLSAIDGRLLEKRKLERAERRWATHGRRVLAWEQAGATVKLRLYDAWSGQTLWSSEVAQASRGCIIEGEELAVLEPSGRFTIVALANGQVTLRAPLEPEKSLAWIQVLRSDDQYLLLASQEFEQTGGMLVQPITTANSQQSRMHGRVYAFRRQTGKLQWPVPAFISQHCLPNELPSGSPLLFFVRNRTNANQAGATTRASVLALDRRDGRIVFDSDDCGNTVSNCDITVDPVRRTTTLTLFSQPLRSYVFRFTEQPVPPQPPAQTGAMASNAVGEPAGALDRTVGAAVEMLRRGLFPAGRAP